MITVQRESVYMGHKHTFEYNKQYRTVRGAENFIKREAERLWLPESCFTIIGEPETSYMQPATTGTVHIGDVYHVIRGCTMTFNDYYEVVGTSKTGKTFIMQPLKRIVSGNPDSPFGGRAYPVTDGADRYAAEPIQNCRTRENGNIIIVNGHHAYRMTQDEISRGNYENHYD